jgi:hypothetical protein
MNLKTKLSMLLFTTCFIAGISNSHAMYVLPVVKCTLTDKLDKYNWPGTKQEVFAASTPEIFFICDSETAYTGDRLKAVWLADHTSRTLVTHTIAVTSKTYIKNPNGGETFEAQFSIKRPPCGWPTGSYHIQLYINGITDKDYPFIVR